MLLWFVRSVKSPFCLALEGDLFNLFSSGVTKKRTLGGPVHTKPFDFNRIVHTMLLTTVPECTDHITMNPQ